MSATLPKLRQMRPTDSGGPIARAGFAFQDHVAARFCIEMLSNNNLKEVWCETYDDIVLVWDKLGQESVEFVQVKAENPDQLWTPAFLCRRDKKKGETEKIGSSIPERSLAKDCCHEDVYFRLVTSWEVNSELEILKLERGHRDRGHETSKFEELLKQVQEKIGDYKSAKGNGCNSWLQRMLWEIDSQQNLEKINCFNLLKVLEQMGSPIATDSAMNVYSDLLTLVKQAAEKLDAEREKKFLKAEEVRAFIKKQAAPFPGLGPSETLDKKLSDAKLPDTDRASAQELRRAYLMAVRTRSYLETGGAPTYTTAILHKLLRLRTERDSGQLPTMDDMHFHALCLQRVNDAMAAPASNSDATPAELGAGCMYDITARCRHRFTQVNG
jgi:hypothetical protein